MIYTIDHPRLLYHKVSEYEQEITRSHTEDQPTAP